MKGAFSVIDSNLLKVILLIYKNVIKYNLKVRNLRFNSEKIITKI